MLEHSALPGMRLRTYESYWLLKNGLLHSYPSISGHHRCDLLVVGAGITGMLPGWGRGNWPARRTRQEIENRLRIREKEIALFCSFRRARFKPKWRIQAAETNWLSLAVVDERSGKEALRPGDLCGHSLFAGRERGCLSTCSRFSPQKLTTKKNRFKCSINLQWKSGGK